MKQQFEGGYRERIVWTADVKGDNGGVWGKFREDLRDFEKFSLRFLRIKDEAGKIIPFVMNTIQKRVYHIMEDLRLNNRPIWIMILKCRQAGISTLIEAYIFWRTYVETNQKCVIIGHEIESSQNLFDIYQRYYEHLPKELKPKIDRNQRDKKLSYKITRNEVVIQTAGANISEQKAGTGRSGTFQYIHATEAAFYPDYMTTFKALLQASKKAKMIIIETTANGFNDFREDWFSAKEIESDYSTIFLSWLDFYSKQFRSEEEKQAFIRDLGVNGKYNLYPDEEKILIKEYGATLENLNWRRWAIVNLCKKDINTFHQEYPRDDMEAFVSSGRPVFPMEIVSNNFIKYEKKEKEGEIPLMVGDLEVRYDELNKEYQKLVSIGMTSYSNLRAYIKDVEFVQNRNGFISILGDVRVNQGEHYKFAAAVDVAEGLLQGDYSVIQVMNRANNEIVLEWHGHCDPDLLAIEIHKIQLFLCNKVYFGIERNNHGLAVIIRAGELGVNQYYTEEFNSGRVVESDRLGFSTNMSTRKYALNNLMEWVREKYFVYKRSAFWKECMTFVTNAKGKMQAQDKDKNPGTKCFDDRVISMAILTVVNNWMPNYTKDDPDKLPNSIGNRIKRKYRKQSSVMSE